MSKIEEFKKFNEKLNLFNARTERHIALVAKYLGKMIALGDSRLDNLILEEEKHIHDMSKFEKFEKEPYIDITWNYKLKDQGIVPQLTEEEKTFQNNATNHHITTNKHHPEYWDKDFVSVPKNDRDSVTVGRATRAFSMPMSYIACMVADWMAMSEEKGTSVEEWAKKNIGIRWQFSGEQKQLIEELIETVKVDDSKILELYELKKAKVYVESPADAPEGVAVKTGSKGGHYYESGGAKKEKEEAKPQKTALSEEQIEEMTAELASGFPYQAGHELSDKAVKVFKKIGLDYDEMNMIIRFYNFDKRTDGKYLTTATLLFQSFWAAKFGLDPDMVFRSIIDSGKFEVRDHDGDFHTDFTYEELRRDVSKYADVEKMPKLMLQSHEAIKELFDSKKMMLYRGCSRKSAPQSLGEKVEFSSIFPISRWTFNPEIAIDFAHAKDGFVIKAEVTADKIVAMDFVTSSSGLSDEVEADIDHRGIVGTVYEVKNNEENVKALLASRKKIEKAMMHLDITDDQNWIAETRTGKIKKSADASLKQQIELASKLTGINHFIITGLDNSFSKDAQEKLNVYAKDNSIQIAIELAKDGQELVVDRIKLLKDIKKAEDNIFGIFTPPKIAMVFFEDNFNAKDLWDRWGRDKLSRGSKISVEPKYDGFRAILTKKEGTIRLWLIESQQERAIILGELIEKLLTIPFDFAIDGVLKTDISILNDDYQPDGKAFEYTMFDAPYIDSDNTDYSYEYRREKLKELFKAHFTGLKNFAIGHSEIVENRVSFFSAAEKLLGSGKSVIVKDIAGRYTFGETDNVNRARKKAEIKVIVLDKEMDADGKWIYTCGVLS